MRKITKGLKRTLAITLSAALVGGGMTIIPGEKASAATNVKKISADEYSREYTGSQITVDKSDITVLDEISESEKYIVPSTEWKIKSHGANVNAGTGTVTIENVAGNYAIEETEIKFLIKAKSVTQPTIELGPNSFVYNGDQQKPTVTVKDGETTISSNEYKVEYSYDGGVTKSADLDTSQCGTITVIVSDNKIATDDNAKWNGDDGNYIINQASTTYTILPAENTLTLSATSGNLTYLEGPRELFTISTNTSRGALSATVDDTNIADVSIDEGKVIVTGKKAGSTDITINSAATTNYNAASATYTLTVDKADMDVTVTNGSGTFDNTEQTLGKVSVTTPSREYGYTIEYSDEYTSETNSPVYTHANEQPTIKDAGTYYVYYKVTDEKGNYNEKTGHYTVTMNRLNTATATAKTGLIYTGELLSGVAAEHATLGGVFEATNAGTYSATAVPESNYSWSDGTITEKPIEYTIAKAENEMDLSSAEGTVVYKQSVSFDVSKNISGGALNISSSDLDVAIAEITGTHVTVTGTGVGTATITVSSAENDNYNAGHADYRITVTQASLSSALVTATDGSGTYTGSPQTLGTVTASPKNLNNEDEAYKIAYSAAYKNNIGGEEHPYGEAQPSATASGPAVTEAGTYTVYYKITSDNYLPYEGSYTVTISKAENTIMITPITDKVYNDADFSVSLSVYGNETSTVTWSVESGNATISQDGTAVHITGTGAITVKASKAETDNYNACSATTTFNVSAAPISAGTITINHSVAPGSYNGAIQNLTVAVSDTLISEGDSRARNLTEGVDFTVNHLSDRTNAGVQTYTINGIGNYTGASAVQSYTITCLDLTGATLAPETASKVYDSLTYRPALTSISATTSEGDPMTISFSDITEGADNDYTIEYAKVTDDVEGVRSNTTPTDIGSYKLYVIGTGKGNITGTTIPMAFTISQRDIGNGTATVEFSSAEYVYNGLTQEITPTVKWVLNNGGSEQILTINDYDVEYAGDRVNASDDGITVTVKGKGNFTGQATGTYKIIPYTVQATDDPNITITETDTAIINNGATINFADHISVISALGEEAHTLIKDMDYTLEKTNATDPDRDGQVTMVLKFIGNYKDQNIAGHTYTANVSYKSTTGAILTYDSSTGTLTVTGGGDNNIDNDIRNRIAATGATSVVIGEGAGKITSEAFRGTDKEHITAITVLNGSEYSAVDGMLLSGDGTTLIAAPFGLTATNITIPNGVTSISNGAFSGMTGITEIAFPASLQAIGEGAFDGCSGLVSANLTGTAIADIGKNSFKGTALTAVTIPSGATAHEGAFSNIATLTNVTIEGAAEPGAFSGISSLDNLSITDTASIETGALDNGTTITALTIDGNPTIYSDEPGKINEETFFGAVMPTAVSITNNNELETMPSGSTSDAFLIRKDGEEKVLVKTLKPITAVEIPDGVTAISENAFKDKTEITSATFPSTLKAIGSNSFKGTGLTSVTVPSGVIVKTGAFSNITTLNSVTINGAKVETGAFSGSADPINALTINAGSDIETGAFKENLSVGHLTINGVSTVYSGTENEISSEFFSKHSFSDISISDNNDFETMANGAEADSFLVAISGGEKTIIKVLKSAADITIPDGVTGIGGGVFKDNATLRNVTILASVTSIGAGAFEGSGLTSVTLSEGLLNIGGNAFKGTAIMEIDLPSTLNTIGDSAFEGTGLMAISIPEGVTTIGNSAFKGTGLTTVVIPSTITTIGTDVFSGTSITDITVPESVPADETTFGDSWTRLTVVGEQEKTVTTRSTVSNGDGTTTTTISSETTNVSTGAFIRSREVATTRKDADSSVVQTRTTTGERTEDGGKKLVTVTETFSPTGKETSTKTVIKDSLGVTTSAKETIVTEENAMNGGNTVKTVTTVEKEGDNEDSMTEEKTTVVRTEKDPGGEEVDKTTTVTVRTPSGTKETMERHYYETDINGNKVTVDVKTITERDEDGNETSYTEIRKTDVTVDGVRAETTTELIYTTEGGVRTLTGKTEVIKTTTPNEHGSTVRITTNIYDPEHPYTIASTSEEVTNYDHEGHVIKTKVAEVNVDDSAASKFGHLIVQDVSGGDGWDETYSLTATTVTEEMTEESTEKIKESTKTSAYAVLDIGFTQCGTPVEMPTSQYTLTFKYPADWPSPSTVNPEFYWYNDTANTMQKLNAEFVTIGGETYVQATLNHFSYYVITYAKKASGGSGGSGGTGGGSTGGGSTGGGGGFIITTHTVTYTDGVEGEEVFKDQTFKKNHGSDTPVFSGTPEREGYTFTGWDPVVEKKVTRDITYTAQWVKKGEEKPIDWHEEEPGEEEKPNPVITTLIKIFRLFNPLGFHLFTTNANERDYLMSLGWNDEGTGFSAAEDATIPVYRLYNPYNGDHLFTADAGERDHVVPLGWIYEGVAFKAQETGTPIYRLFNTTTGEHFYTRNELERNFLAGLGWRPEGVAFYMSE